MRVTVDISGVNAVTRRARRELRGVGRLMHRVLERAAQRAATRHPYQNRTGDMTASTTADVVSSSPDETVIEFGSTAEHASYLERGAWSTLSENAAQAEDEIGQEFEAMGDRID